MTKFSPTEPSRDLEKVADFLDSHGVPYVLIGGLALSIWGRPRTTLDLDFLILIDENEIDKFKQQAAEDRIEIDRRWLKYNPLLQKNQVRFRAGQTTVDFMIPRDDHDREALTRARRKKLGRRFYRITSAEDFILQKLKVGRPRDFEDVVTVLERMRGKLDKRYLKRWANQLGIAGELHYVLTL